MEGDVSLSEIRVEMTIKGNMDIITCDELAAKCQLQVNYAKILVARWRCWYLFLNQTSCYCLNYRLSNLLFYVSTDVGDSV